MKKFFKEYISETIIIIIILLLFSLFMYVVIELLGL